MSQNIEIERRLAAVLAADVAGFSRLTEADEVGTMRMLAAQRAILDSAISRHRGRIANTAGDSVLAEFPSAVNAVQCAVEAQQALRDAVQDMPEDRRVLFRIGIHVGDVMVRGGDLLGSGVNVAARVEGECEPGGVYLSDDTYRQVRAKTLFAFDDLGEKQLKNIDRPVRIYAARAVTCTPAGAAVPEMGKLPPLREKASIAVLPFQNMSGDPEQEYFADGLVEEIITALSRFKSLIVIARNSSFTFKGKAVDIKQAGRDLGARYVLEGSVRKAAGRVRVTGQLIDASNGSHIWADRFDGPLDNIFALQDSITSSVAAAIVPKMYEAEIERIGRKPTENLVAYDFLLRGLAKFSQGALDEALSLFYRAIELDPTYASPHSAAALCFVYLRGKGQALTPDDIAETARLARRAIELGKDHDVVLSNAGTALAYVVGELDEASVCIERSLALNQNQAVCWANGAWFKVWAGEPDAALDYAARAMRLNPLGTWLYYMHGVSAHAHFFAGRYDEASFSAAKALSMRKDYVAAWHMAAASHAMAGRLEEARTARERIQQIDPALRVSNLAKVLGPYRRQQDRDRYAEGLRRAGLPE